MKAEDKGNDQTDLEYLIRDTPGCVQYTVQKLFN